MKRLVVARNSDGTEFLVLHANGEHVQKNSGKYQFICYQIKDKEQNVPMHGCHWASSSSRFTLSSTNQLKHAIHIWLFCWVNGTTCCIYFLYQIWLLVFLYLVSCKNFINFFFCCISKFLFMFLHNGSYETNNFP